MTIKLVNDDIFACMSEAIRLHPTFLSVYLFYRYKIQDTRYFIFKSWAL